jgi:hypothetical protein
MVFIISAACKRTEKAPPGSPEYEAELSELVKDCVIEWMERDLQRSRIELPVLPNRAEYEATCRAVTIKTMDLYPEVHPRRRIPN